MLDFWDIREGVILQSLGCTTQSNKKSNRNKGCVYLTYNQRGLKGPLSHFSFLSYIQKFM